MSRSCLLHAPPQLLQETYAALLILHCQVFTDTPIHNRAHTTLHCPAPPSHLALETHSPAAARLYSSSGT